jgi:diguanylate cyclase (GGDEF)-like protein/PAS domain S-box-containing protein
MSDKSDCVATVLQAAAGQHDGAHDLLQDRFRFLAEFSSDWYWEQDETYRFTYMARNKRSEASFPAQYSLGKTRWEIPYEDTTEEFWASHKRDLELRRPFHDFILKRRNNHGSLRYTSISGAPIFDANGMFKGYRGIGRDVTDQIAARQRQSAEHQITKILSESSDIDSTISAVIRIICTTLDWNLGAYFVLDRRSNTLVRTHLWHSIEGDLAEFLNASVSFRRGFSPDMKTDQAPGLMCRAWLTQEPVWIESIVDDPSFSRSDIAQKVGLNSAFALPVIAGNVVFGVMEFFRKDSCWKDPLLIDTLASISRQIALFLHRKQRDARQSMQNIVTRTLADSGTLDDAMPKIIETICKTLAWDYGAYWALDEGSQNLQCRSEWSSQSISIDQWTDRTAHRPVPVGEIRTGSDRSALGRLWHDHEPIWIADIEAEQFINSDEAGRSRRAAQCGLQSLFGFPILSAQRMIGLVEFFSHHIRQPDDLLIETASAIGIQIGLFCQRKQDEEKIHYLAYHDSLTGIPNRTLFNFRLQHAIHQAKRHDRKLGVLFIDLDRFKLINDTLGHDTGDRLLQEMATRFSRCLRETDTIARLGGDEFVVLLEDIESCQDAAIVAHKINRLALEPFTTSVGDCQITASIGISLYPQYGLTEQALMKNADIAMYQAKDSGKNTYRFYSEEINNDSLKRLSLESRLRRALERKEFLLHYQPRVSLPSGRVIGMEALIRWHCADMGTISPADFIPIAEELGLINEIGEWVLYTACAQAKRWAEQGLPPLILSVNLSARQFNDQNLLIQLRDVLVKTGLPPQQLELEITESMVMHDPDEAVKILNEMRSMGVSISMDDFGTGYSSLSQLIRFPINTLKIDRAFVTDVARTKEHAAIAAATIAMSKALGLNVVAEGVETNEQVEFLNSQQCNEAQGFYFSKPVPADVFPGLFNVQPVKCTVSDDSQSTSPPLKEPGA